MYMITGLIAVRVIMNHLSREGLDAWVEVYGARLAIDIDTSTSASSTWNVTPSDGRAQTVINDAPPTYSQLFEKGLYSFINPHTLFAQKVADEVVFRRFKGEGVEFFLIGPH